MARNLRHLRHKYLPEPPKSFIAIDELFQQEHIMKNYGVTCHDEPRQFFKGNYFSDAFSYCVFASETNIQIMTEKIPVHKRNLLMDATFASVPSDPGFTQLLVIYVEYFKEVKYTYQFLEIDSKIYLIFINSRSFPFYFV